MFFAYWVLRPAVENLALAEKINLWAQVLQKFFSWVWLISFSLPVTGYWMVFHELGGFQNVGIHIHVMHIMGWIMILLFLYVYFSPFKKLLWLTKEKLYPEAGLYMVKIRRIVLINLLLGVVVSTLATVGPFL
ncbi:MAG: CopD family protein [Magnetococcales bacterium]|nr:CopD family protein [Magnetococcales bacterium]